MPLSNKIILIDAGHGGWDPGKIAGKNIFEKDINLSIAIKLQEYLEQSGAFVFMTRTTDTALRNKKMSDMRNRKEISNQTKADMMLSIHQNFLFNFYSHLTYVSCIINFLKTQFRLFILFSKNIVQRN